MIKNYVIAIVAAGLIGLCGLAYVKYTNLKTELLETQISLTATTDSLAKAVEVNRENETTIKNLRTDNDTNNRLIEELKQKSKEVKIVEKDRIVYVEKLAKEDPINTRPLSPVLRDTIETIQKGRSR